LAMEEESVYVTLERAPHVTDRENLVMVLGERRRA